MYHYKIYYFPGNWNTKYKIKPANFSVRVDGNLEKALRKFDEKGKKFFTIDKRREERIKKK